MVIAIDGPAGAGKSTVARDYLNLAAAHAWAGFCAFRVGLMREALEQSESGVRLMA